jgi:hypothetical protein
VGLFSKKTDKTAKMRVMKVTLDSPKKRARKTPKKAAKPMSFTEWVEHYAKMSGGNPV